MGCSESAVVRRLISEAAARELVMLPRQPADRPAIAAIVGRVRSKSYGLRTLIHEIVRSELFQHR